MRITAISETSVPVASAMRNAAFNFFEMTTSVVAVTTDVMRAGRPVTGYAFNSTLCLRCGDAGALHPAHPFRACDGMEVRGGEIALPSYPGIAFEAQPALYRIMCEMTDG